MERKILTTKDGSTTIHIIDWNESYHSRHGAVQEAEHVFIKNGLDLIDDKSISILEIGFGTGLNAFITYLESIKRHLSIAYTGIEAYPITAEEISAMNYVNVLDAGDKADDFLKMHNADWEIAVQITDTFTLTKRKILFQEITYTQEFDIIYFDAFGYDVQPELWSTEIFKSMFDALKTDGILVTYAARGVVKRSMIEVGFTVEKLPGPPGKREMFRARKG